MPAVTAGGDDAYRARLCDDGRATVGGVTYACTGSTHVGGVLVTCTSPTHQLPVVEPGVYLTGKPLTLTNREATA